MSALGERAAGELGAGVLHRLSVLESAALGIRAREDVAAIRAEMVAMIRLWRRLLEDHVPIADSGSCPLCPGRWWRRKRWPCGIWKRAHHQLITLDQETPPAESPEGRLAVPSQRAAPPIPGRAGVAAHPSGARPAGAPAAVVVPRIAGVRDG